MKFILKYIARQFGNPTGFGGNISTFIMNYLNQKQYKTVVANLNIQATDTVLDAGFGNGYLLGKLSKQNLLKIYGVEISADMINTAAKKNRKEIKLGTIQLLLSDVQNLPLEDFSIDKAYTINTIYFWKDIYKGLSEIKRTLKSDGLFLNVLYLKEWLDKLPITKYGFTKYTVEQIEKATVESGLKIERIVEIQSKKSICIISRKETLCLTK
ncbi:MAG: class I SAM-dependent methyltransferase [Cytophagaceae bacterium]|jgi:ubiquinone/menaquinone biosynthesis C-methylase UbiE|nr:class I SAM-dependent methyltransferase [Cytophagaceae bacterium]